MSNSAAIQKIGRVLDTALALLYPNVCQICREGRATQAEGYVCHCCRTQRDGVQKIEAPYCRCCGLPFDGEVTVTFECANCRDERLYFRSARAAVKLTGLVQDVIHRYKYNQAAWFEPFLAELLIQSAAPSLGNERWDFIVPIPLHWLKVRERTFNQSERLAKRLSAATGIPVNTRLLRRKTRTSTQTSLSRAQRAENVKRAFSWRPRTPLDGARIVLVDDVLTTGATASSCAKVLMQNGAGVVDVWTVARGTLQ
jgi:ComF family protein